MGLGRARKKSEPNAIFLQLLIPQHIMKKKDPKLPPHQKVKTTRERLEARNRRHQGGAAIVASLAEGKSDLMSMTLDRPNLQSAAVSGEPRKSKRGCPRGQTL